MQETPSDGKGDISVVSLARALRDFQRGKSSEDELLEQLELILSDGRSHPGGLLETLDAHNREHALTEDLNSKIRDRIVEVAAGFDEADDWDATQVATSYATDDAQGDREAETAPIDRSMQPIVPERGLAPPGPGDTLSDRFVLEEMIGQGGMSRVFRAIDKFKVRAGSRSPEVAVKLMDVSGMAEDNAFMVVQREVQKLQSLSHHNIVRVIEGYQDPSGALFITMEHLSGQPLSRRIAELGRDTMPVEKAMEYIRQIGEALHFAHQQRIVHADFKPSNAFMTDDDQVKVIDFGIARAFRKPDDSPEDMTVFDPRDLGALTPAYASPEMIEGQDPDPRDDVYSLGCVAYELLTGRHPYSRVQSTEARREGLTPTKPSCLNRTQWKALSSALALTREDRTAGVDQFLRDFLPREKETPWGMIGIGAVAVAAIAFAFWPQPTPQPTPQPSPPVGESPKPPVDDSVEKPIEKPIEVVVRPPPPEPGTLIQDCPQCPELVVLPAGSSTIGLEAGSDSAEYLFETPAYTVTFDQPFAMGVAEVTLGQFRAYLHATGNAVGDCRTLENGWVPDTVRSWENPGWDQSEDHPVTCVSWRDAQRYSRWLSGVTGTNYRLPSEAEWEYAARISGPGMLEDVGCEGTNVADQSIQEIYPGIEVAECDDTFAHTAPIEAGAPGEYELRHLRGNVFEWTQDCWNDSHAGAPANGEARETEYCDEQVLRGGSWLTAPDQQRITYRNRHPSSHRANTFGFRVVKDLGSKDERN